MSDIKLYQYDEHIDHQGCFYEKNGGRYMEAKDHIKAMEAEKRLNVVSADIIDQQNRSIEAQAKEIEQLKNNISTIKMGFISQKISVEMFKEKQKEIERLKSETELMTDFMKAQP